MFSIKKAVFPFLLLLFTFPSHAQSDSTTIRFNFLERHFLRTIPTHDSLISFRFQLLPNAAQSFRRVNLLSDFTKNGTQYEINSSVQRYYDQYSDYSQETDLLNLSMNLTQGIANELPSYIPAYTQKLIANLNEKDQLYAAWRAQTVHVQSEAELYELTKRNTRQMIDLGYTDLGTDLLPFISVLMQEQHIFHYDPKRVLALDKAALGVVSAIEMLSAMASLDTDNKAGVCRDTHDSGLRIARSMYDEYLQYRYPDADYDVDNYLFLYGWVTPPSQHITLLVIDPTNPRNLHELDWGRVYQKTDQEGASVGNTIGTSLRLFRFDVEKNQSVPFDMIKTQWGLLFDQQVLSDDEFTFINGIYAPLYSNQAEYARQYGRGGVLRLSEGTLNAGQPFSLASFSYRTQQLSMGKLLHFDGLLGIQSMLIEDSERKNYTLSWADWRITINFFNLIRYMANVSTRKFWLNKNLSLHFFANADMDIFLSLAYFDVENGDDLDNSHSNGDGNIWFTYGAKWEYRHPNQKTGANLQLIQRNFLMPSDVRYLSPNPLALLGHARLVNNGKYAQLDLFHSAPKSQSNLLLAMEQDLLLSRFYKIGFKQAFFFNKQHGIQFSIQKYKQFNGLEYFWYPKERILAQIAFLNRKKNRRISLDTQWIADENLVFGLSFRKTF